MFDSFIGLLAASMGVNELSLGEPGLSRLGSFIFWPRLELELGLIGFELSLSPNLGLNCRGKPEEELT